MRRRRFTPSVGRPERRDNPGPLWGGWWEFPQADIRLTDDAGHEYPASNGQELIAGLEAIAIAGRSVGELAIKGHGYGGEVIMLTDADTDDTLAVIQGHILIGGEDVDALMRSVTGPNSTIWLTGCDTGAMGAPMSGTLGDGATVYVNLLPYAIGIPFTGHSVGAYSPYTNGGPRAPGPQPNLAEGEFGP